MTTIMIVEDEPPILRDIKKMIETMGMEFKVTCCAYNGHEAIQMLESSVPDVVFTDIQMPVIDGLALLEYIHDKFPAIIPVVLSGYSEFEYARKAMALGVDHYLLKPLNEEELRSLLINISNKIKKQKYAHEKEYISSLIENEKNSMGVNKIICDSPPFFIILICAGSLPSYSMDYYSPAFVFWKENRLESFIDYAPDKDEDVWVFDGKTSSEKIVIFSSHNCAIKNDQITAALYKKLDASHFPITMVASPIINRIEDIGSQLQSMRIALKKSLIIGSSQIIMPSRSSKTASGEINQASSIDCILEDRLTMYIRQGNLPLFKSDLQKLFRQWENSRITQLQAEARLRYILSFCYRTLSAAASYDIIPVDNELLEAISVSISYTELFENIWYLFEGLFDSRSIKSSNKDSMAVTMRKIDKYIQANLTRQINTQKLSEEFGLVPSYLSMLFKDYKGLSPSDYLLKLRVEKAKALISSQPDFLTKDIAEAIGYQDPLYFSKVFKKETGMSPTEYKNKVKGQDKRQ